jgi:hypothetical protein
MPPIGLFVCICIVARKRLGKHVPAGTNMPENRKIVVRIVIFAACVVSNESLWVCLRIPYCFQATARLTRSRGNAELLEASFSVVYVSYHRKVGD